MLRLQSLMRIHFSQLWLAYERQPHTCFPLNFCQSKFISGASPMHLDLMPTLQQMAGSQKACYQLCAANLSVTWYVILSALPALHVLNITWQIARTAPLMQASAETIVRCSYRSPVLQSSSPDFN